MRKERDVKSLRDFVPSRSFGGEMAAILLKLGRTGGAGRGTRSALRGMVYFYFINLTSNATQSIFGGYGTGRGASEAGLSGAMKDRGD